MISPLASPFRGGWRNLTPMRARGRGGQNPWTPGYLSDLRAWYDAELGQPKNVGYVQLDGTAGDYIYTPDSVATSFSNDIEVVMRVKVTDWTAASGQTLVGKYVSTGNQRSWRFYVNTSGAIGLTASADGTAVTSIIVTPTNALPDNTWIWLRMRLDLTNGSNSVGTLETAADAGTNTEPSSWTANGTNTGTTISGIFDSTAPTEIGAFGSGTLERMTGQVGRCIVRSGFAGTTVVDFNASDCYGDGYWHSGGYRWTLGLPKIYDRGPNGLAPATFGSGSNQPKWLPWEGRSQVYFPGGTFGTNKIQATVQPAAKLTGGIEWEFINCRFPVGTSSIVEAMGAPTDGGWAVRLTGGVPYIIYTDGANYIPVFAAVTVPVYLQQGTGCLLVRRDSSTGIVSFFVKENEGDTYSLLDSVTGPTGDIYSVTYNPEAGFNINGGVGLDDGLIGTFIMRNGFGGPVVMKFDSVLCGQDGYLDDDTGHDWAIYRPTTGRKIVVQSPAGWSARSVILFGTDDWATAPAAAAPPLGISDSATVTTAVRQHATAASFRWYWAITSGGGTELMSMQQRTTNFCKSVFSDGVTTIDSSPSPAFVNGTMTVVGARVQTRTAYAAYVNGGSPATQSPAAIGALTPAAFTIGALVPAGAVQEFEFGALLVRDIAEADTEHGLQVAYYGGGL